VRAHRDALYVFLQSGGDDIVHAAVVAEVDHLRAHALQDATHDVDRGVVAVEQARGRDEADLVGRTIAGQRLEFGGQVGHGGSRNTVTLLDVYVNVNSRRRALSGIIAAPAVWQEKPFDRLRMIGVW